MAKKTHKQKVTAIASDVQENNENYFSNENPLDMYLLTKGIWGKISIQIIEWLPLILALSFYSLLKFYALRASSSDENIYFYMAWAMNNHGAIPYMDYFFAHPPLQLFIMAMWIAVFGFHLEGAKAVPWLAFLVSAFFFHRLLRSGYGRISSFVGLILYVFAYDVLRASSHFTGINSTIMFLVPSFWALWKYRNAMAGVFLSLGALCGTYIMPAGGFTLLWVFLGRGKKATWRYFLGLSIPYTLVTITFMILAGPLDYLNMQFRYHVIKPEQGGEAIKRFLEVSYDNHLLALSMWSGGLFLLASLIYRFLKLKNISIDALITSVRQWARHPFRVRALFALGIVITYMSFLFNLKRVFPFYYLLVFSSMAWLGAYLTEEGVRFLYNLVTNKIPADKLATHLTIAFITLTAVIGLYAYRYNFGLNHVKHHMYFRKQMYQWRDAPYLGPTLNSFIKSVTWEDYAYPKQQPNAIKRVMWHETFFLEKIYDVASYIKSKTNKEDLLFGDSTSLPLIALLAQRRIIDDFADTNIMRFRSHMTSPIDAINQVNRPELKYLIPRRMTGFFRIPEFQSWAENDFLLEKQVPERYKGMFLIYRRKESSL